MTTILKTSTSLIIDPFIIRFLATSIEPPPPLPPCVFFYDPHLVVPPPPLPISSLATTFNQHHHVQSVQQSTKRSLVSQSTSKSNHCNRHRYTPVQLFTLNRIFSQLPYPSMEQRRLIAEHLCMDMDQVRVWFSNRRSRQRFNSQPVSILQPSTAECAQSRELLSRLNLCV